MAPMDLVIDRAAVSGDKSKARGRTLKLNWRRVLALAVNVAVWALVLFALYHYLHHGR
jgi:hypothetical protein